MFKKIEKESFYYGSPIVLMTTKDKESGLDCLTPVSSTWTLSKSVVIGLGLHNQGYLNLEKGSELTLNIADENIWEKIEAIAKLSGNHNLPMYKKEAGYEYCLDKFTVGGFNKLSGVTVETVRLRECPIHLETQVTNVMERRDYGIVECTIKAIFVHEELLADAAHISVDKWQPLIYKFREYTTTGKALGKNFRFQEASESL